MVELLRAKGIGLTLERQQNMPTQNMLLWHKDCFELKSLEKQQIPERLSDLSFFFLKGGDKIPIQKMFSLYQKENNKTFLTQRQGALHLLDGYCQKGKRYQMLASMWRKEKPCTVLAGM